MSKRLMRRVAVLSFVATLVVSMGLTAASAVANTIAKTACKQQMHQVTVITVQYKAAVKNAKDSKGDPNEPDAKVAVKKTKTKLTKAKKRAATCAKKVKAAADKAAKAAVPQKAANQCEEGYNVVFDEHDGNKVISHAQAELPVDKPQQAVKLLMQYAQHDPSILQLYWNSSPLGKDAPIADWATLQVDGCYTSAARDQFNELLGLFKGATVVSSSAPAVGVNTGVQAVGNVPFQETPGPIGGDLTAVKVTFANGDVIWIMKRCGNVVTQSSIPSVPTKPVPAPNTPPSPCLIPPIGVPPQFWDTVNCKKLDSTFDFQQNGNQFVTPVQFNPCCVITQPGVAPTPNQPGPTPVAGTPVPAPIPAPGYTAPVAPGGSTTTPDGGTTGGGPTPPSTTVPVDTGDHTTDSGGF